MRAHFERPEQNTLSEMNEALQHIEHVRSMIASWGNVDNSEHEFLTQVAQQLQSGAISPVEAKQKATRLFESKNLR